ncbi:S1 family peptidase [Thermococcus thioreducens]|nr:S1 family peptidase [Thermococcus thioreducens]
MELVGINELKGKFSTSLPSYGGMFINEEKGLIFVYVKDEKDKEELKQALGKYRGKVNVVFLRGKYSFEQLVKWKNLALNLDIEKLGISGIDADEAHNMLTIELTKVTQEKLKTLEHELDRLRIPKTAIRIEEVGRMSLDSSPTEVFDPLIGGIGIRISPGDSSTCTLGFTAKISGEDYFVTAGHCAGFGNTGDSVYQPWGNGSWRKVGIVFKNPPLRYENGNHVRESDSLLVKVSGRGIAPQIYSGWEVEGTTISVVGLYVCKFGIGTRETNCGHVMKTNKVSVLKGNILITDTSEVVGMEHAGGDSGAPVFVKPYYTPSTRIVGIHFGGVEGTTITGFSEIDGIFRELGNMRLHTMGKRSIIAVSILLLLFFGAFVFSRAMKTAEIYVTVYYPGELEADGYYVKDDQITLKFHVLKGSEGLKGHFEKFKIRCFLCNLDLENATVVVDIDGTPLYPTCRDYIMSFDKGGNIKGMHYVVSPYNLTEIAKIRILEGYGFRELKFENNTLIVLLSPGNGEEVEIIRSNIIAEHQKGLERGWIKVVYTDGSKKWEGRVYSMGKGECPVLIEAGDS